MRTRRNCPGAGGHASTARTVATAARNAAISTRRAPAVRGPSPSPADSPGPALDHLGVFGRLHVAGASRARPSPGTSFGANVGRLFAGQEHWWLSFSSRRGAEAVPSRHAPADVTLDSIPMS